MERRRLNLEFWRGLSEVGVLACIHKRVVARNGVFERIGGHRLSLILVHDFPSQFRNGVYGEEISLRRIHMRRSEEHTSELQSPDHLVCRLLLEKKKTKQQEIA